MRVWQRLRLDPPTDLIDGLDEESRLMILTALRVGAFLERSPSGPDALRAPREDFTPGAQGVWKAFELEVNLSVIQAARAARNVRMPEYFRAYDPSPTVRGMVETGRDRAGRPIVRDINQRDSRARRRAPPPHRFLSLGDAFFVEKAMQGRPTERFDQVVEECLAAPLPSEVLKAWERLFRLRNESSHIRALDRNGYERILDKGLAPDVLRPLMQIKKALSGR
jgi:hypothetical protein